MTKKNKTPYASIDDITSGIDDSPAAIERPSVRRPSRPVAARVITQESAPAEGGGKALLALREKADSIEKIMPVTKTRVRLRLVEVDPSLVDVSPENERDQGLLDESAVSDILPSFQQTGQQQPGTLRPKDNGRYELIEGSRRLFCAKLTGRGYLALLGDIPDADVRTLSRTENVHKPPSAYERAMSYQRDIDSGRYSSWAQLAAAEGVSKSTMSGYTALVETDRVFVQSFPDPNSLSAKNALWIRKTRNQSEKVAKALHETAIELISKKKSAIKAGQEPLLPDEVMTEYRRAARSVSSSTASGPTSKEPIIYRSTNRSRSVKHSVTRDGKAVKFEMRGVPQKTLDELLAKMKEIVGVE